MKHQFNFALFIFVILLLISCEKNVESVPISDNVIMTINIKAQTISFLNIDKKQDAIEWNLSEPYTGGFLLHDNDSLVLYGKQVDSVDIYSLSKGEKIDSWKTGRGIVNGYLLKDETIAFADQHSNKVRFFTLSGKEIGSVLTGKAPLTILQQDSNEDLLYVISFDDKLLSIINLQQMQVEKSFSIHSNAAGALIKEGNNEIWIGGHGEGNTIETNIHVYKLSTGELIKKIPAPLMPVNFIEYDNYTYALSHGSSTVYKFDENGELIGSLKVAANPFHMTILNEWLIVAGYDSDNINCIDLETFTVSKTISVGNGPFQIIVRENN